MFAIRINPKNSIISIFECLNRSWNKGWIQPAFWQEGKKLMDSKNWLSLIDWLLFNATCQFDTSVPFNKPTEMPNEKNPILKTLIYY